MQTDGQAVCTSGTACLSLCMFVISKLLSVLNYKSFSRLINTLAATKCSAGR